jgi:hypothetical protein
MARAPQTTQVATNYKLAPTLTQPTADGDIVDTGDVRVWVHNGSGGSINVTVTATATVEGLAVGNLVVAVAAGTDALIGPIPKTAFGQKTGDHKGRAFVDYSSQTSVTRAVVGT